MPKTVLLIDGDILIFRACAAATVSVEWEPGLFSNSSDAEQAKQRVDEDLVQWKRELKADTLVVTLSDHTANFRKELDPTYKANRTTPKPASYMAVEEYVIATYTTKRMRGLEADDVVGILATRPNPKKLRRIIVSIDKDMQTVPGRLYNPGRPLEGVREITEDEADYAHMLQTLVGDRVDNFPGCPGIGPKRAEKLLAPAAPSNWVKVVKAFKDAGQTEEQALMQARLARILRHGEYNEDTGDITLWRPAA